MKHYVAPGKTLPAMSVSTDTAVGLVTLNQLEHFGVKSPWLMARTARAKLDPLDQPFKDLREIVQRTWDKPRARRADLYSTYIENVQSGNVDGGTPPITIYVDQQGAVDEANGEISFPYTSSAIAIDGETQLEARFRLRLRDPESGNVPFPVTIYHGCKEQKAMQILHDFNHFAKPIPESKLGMRNTAGGISQTVEDAVGQVPGASLNTSGASGTKKHVAGFAQTMFFVAGYALGNLALQRSGTTWFDELNTPGAPPINGKCSTSLAELLAMASVDRKLRGAPTYLWQVAGVLAHEGRSPNTLNWDAAFAAYRAAPGIASGLQGGNRGKTEDRLRAIYAAFKS